jgi:ubiquinone/menaquinone biosynthesis C-methylase UbiE
MSYIQELSAAWDTQAEDYDERFASSLVGRYMRNRSLMELRRHFHSGMSVLDIGCGTGEEALALAKSDVKITGIDVSSEMIEAARCKATSLGVKDAEFAVMPAEEIGELNRTFEGAYSSFGVMNCIIDLDDFAKSLAKTIKRNGAFVSSIMNRTYAFEIIYHLIRVKPKTALRRFDTCRVKFEESEEAFDCMYYSPRTFTDHFKPYFLPVKIVALPWLFPLQYMNKIPDKINRNFSGAIRIETRLSDKFPFNRMGDHFLLVLKRL